MRCLAILLFGLLCQAALAGETGYAAREVEVRAEPRNDALLIGKLAKGARFELLERKLSWARISADGRQGWTLFFFLMSGDPPSPQSPGLAVSELWTLGTDRQSSGGRVTATIGTRGLDDAQLASARFDAKELAALEALSQPPQAAAAFAADAGLAKQSVDPLQPSTPLAGATSPGGN
jgi:hypothetical protein